MELFIGIALAIAIIGIALARRKKEDRVNDRSEKLSTDEDSDFLIDFDERFLNEIGDRAATKLVRIYSKKDMAIIRSILQAEGVNTYVQHQSLNNLLPGLSIEGYNDSILSVYESDQALAKQIIEEYIADLRAQYEEDDFALDGAHVFAIPELLI